jgi:type I restriction enzyme R subunit
MVEQGGQALDSLPPNIRKNKEAMAEVVENNLRKVIVEEHPTNPKYYEKMSVLLDELIRRRKEKTLDYEKYLQEQLALAGEILQPGKSSYPGPINTSAKRALYDNVGRNEALALAIDRQILAARRDGWRDNTIKTREVRNAIQDVLKTFETAEPEAQYLIDLAKNQQEY